MVKKKKSFFDLSPKEQERVRRKNEFNRIAEKNHREFQKKGTYSSLIGSTFD